ncbi:MAG: acetate--CoA ligase family protein [Myxococcales bacterium]|nr:acetate--CoA ligase family protein [Myxococcales bacterium]
MSQRARKRRPRGLDAIFRPRSVAVVGASSRPGSIGREVLKNLISSDFQGKVFPVNASRDVVLSMKAYPKVSDIPDPVDLAIIVVPKGLVPRVLVECGKKEVGGVVIVTAGFREVGGEGLALERKAQGILERYGIRAIGPNCMGVIHTDPSVRLNASFARIAPPEGNIAFFSQSGALGEAVLGNAARLGLGISIFASMGNQMDITASDVLEYVEQDDRTQVVLLYQESFGDPRRFPAIAKRVARRKPIVAVKSGRSAAGAKAASSHTGALAGTEVAVDALFDECGVLRVGSVEELFEVAQAFAGQPLPAGPRVGVITNAGGPGILAADACAAAGLELPALSKKTLRRLEGKLHPDASLRNPLDLIASAGHADYLEALSPLLADEGLDALMVIFVPPVMIDAPAVARAIVEARRAAPDKPVLATFMGEGAGAAEGIALLRAAGIPTYAFPESAAKALGAMVRYGRWRARPEGTIPRARVRKEEAAKVMKRIRRDAATRGGFAQMRDGFALLEAYGIPVAETRYATDLEGALGAAAHIGYPVALKIDAPSLVHKTDAGGVAAGLRDEAELVRAYRAMPRPEGGQFVVQAMLSGAVETVLGMVSDPAFGPLLMFGMGGIWIELFEDVAFKVHPLTDIDAAELIAGVRGTRLLEGFRGAPAADREALQDALLRLSKLVSDFPDIVEMEINPFFAAPIGQRSGAVDVRLRVEPR